MDLDERKTVAFILKIWSTLFQDDKINLRRHKGMQGFTANDIVEVAVRIEENGIHFYNFAQQIAKTEDAKNLFQQLAAAEAAHKRTFEKFLSQIEAYTPPERYAGEYTAYLRNYVDNNLIFTKDVMDKQLSKVTDTLGAVEFAIQRELASFFYCVPSFFGMRRFQPRMETRNPAPR
jgi:rubrerythrin